MTNIVVKATPCRNTAGGIIGRINYITSKKKQEYLEDFYDTHTNERRVDWDYYREIEKHCKEQFDKYATDKQKETGIIEEGREFMIVIPNEYTEMYSSQELCEREANRFKETTDCDCVAAAHWNRSHTSFHIHVVTSENIYLNEIQYGAIENRNRYYDVDGKQSTKQKCVDQETKQLLPGCSLVKKGERKETYKKFSAKVNEIAEDSFLENTKQFYAELFNEELETNEFTVYNEEESLGIKMQSETKGLSEEQLADVQEKNELKREYIDTYNDVFDIAYEIEDEDSINTLQSMRNDLKETAKSVDKDYSPYFELMKKQLKQLQQILERLIEKYESFKQKVKTDLNEVIKAASERSVATSSRHAIKHKSKSYER